MLHNMIKIVKIIKQTQKQYSPKWEHEENIIVTNSTGSLVIELYDYDVVTKDDFIGTVKIPLCDLPFVTDNFLFFPLGGPLKKKKQKKTKFKCHDILCVYVHIRTRQTMKSVSRSLIKHRLQNGFIDQWFDVELSQEFADEKVGDRKDMQHYDKSAIPHFQPHHRKVDSAPKVNESEKPKEKMWPLSRSNTEKTVFHRSVSSAGTGFNKFRGVTANPIDLQLPNYSPLKCQIRVQLQFTVNPVCSKSGREKYKIYQCQAYMHIYVHTYLLVKLNTYTHTPKKKKLGNFISHFDHVMTDTVVRPPLNTNRLYSEYCVLLENIWPMVIFGQMLLQVLFWQSYYLATATLLFFICAISHPWLWLFAFHSLLLIYISHSYV
ncbi:hypothetical protein RFI_20977, partial [Reticulomyxa filosa]